MFVASQHVRTAVAHQCGTCMALAQHLHGTCVALSWHLRGTCVALAACLLALPSRRPTCCRRQHARVHPDPHHPARRCEGGPGASPVAAKAAAARPWEPDGPQTVAPQCVRARARAQCTASAGGLASQVLAGSARQVIALWPRHGAGRFAAPGCCRSWRASAVRRLGLAPSVVGFRLRPPRQAGTAGV